MGDSTTSPNRGGLLSALTAQWGLLFVRGSLAWLFGILALLAPQLTLFAMVLLFGAYAIADGVVALIVAYRTRGRRGFGSLLFEGIIRIAAGVIAFVWPGISAIALLALIAVWAIMVGVMEISSALALRREMSGAWPLPLAGGLSLILGVVLLLFSPMGILGLVWLVGIYAIAHGSAMIALALRLRLLAREMATAA